MACTILQKGEIHLCYITYVNATLAKWNRYALET